MRLLLTRAEADAARTRAALAAMGHQIVISPLIAYVGTGARVPSGVIDGVVATSAQAFAQDCGLTEETRRLVPIFVVGGRTAEAAKTKGFAGKLTQAAQASALVRILTSLAWPPRRLIYLAGRDRKPDLEVALAASELSCETIVVYEAQATPGLNEAAVAALRRGTIDAVPHFSRRSASLFLAAGETSALDVSGLTHLCLSDDVAAPLREAGCQRIRIADTPNETSLLSMIEGDGR